MFYDEVTATMSSGKGGDGCVSFRREKYIPKGGPDGGNGGKGGNIIIEGDENTGDLRVFHFKPQWRVKTGGSGMGCNKHGKGSDSITLKVPVGTVITNMQTGKVVIEILEQGQSVILLEGGKGGRGNATFKSSTNRAPRESSPGVLGEVGTFKFDLKSIADIGLVGFPNAGKSTLTNLITSAEPKMGEYPFTTLNPCVGIIDYPETYQRLQMADIPGLIKGANENKGLGHRFLRHIERCNLLIIIVDMSGLERSPMDDYAELLEELRLHNEALLDKERVVVANKMDIAESVDNLKLFEKKNDVPVYPISCLEETGVSELKVILYNKFFK